MTRITHGFHHQHAGNGQQIDPGPPAPVPPVDPASAPPPAAALSAVTASVNGGGTFGSVAATETALHTSHPDILNVVNNDPNLATLATQNGAAGFLAAPQAFAAGTTASNAPVAQHFHHMWG